MACPLLSPSLIPLEKTRVGVSGWGGDGQYIWKTHRESTGSCGAMECRRREGSQIPWFILESLFEIQPLGHENGESQAVPPRTGRKWRWGAPRDSGGGRNAAVGTEPSSRTPPLCPGAALAGLVCGASSCVVVPTCQVAGRDPALAPSSRPYWATHPFSGCRGCSAGT